MTRVKISSEENKESGILTKMFHKMLVDSWNPKNFTKLESAYFIFERIRTPF
jgi:hypothetical protein